MTRERVLIFLGNQKQLWLFWLGKFNRLPNRARSIVSNRNVRRARAFPSHFFLSPFPTAFYFDLFFLLIRFPTPRISSLATGQAKNGICRFPREKQRKRPQQEISSYSKPRLAFSRCTLESVSHETSRIIAFRNSKAKCFRPGGPRGLWYASPRI